MVGNVDHRSGSHVRTWGPNMLPVRTSRRSAGGKPPVITLRLRTHIDSDVGTSTVRFNAPISCQPGGEPFGSPRIQSAAPALAEKLTDRHPFEANRGSRRSNASRSRARAALRIQAPKPIVAVRFAAPPFHPCLTGRRDGLRETAWTELTLAFDHLEVGGPQRPRAYGLGGASPSKRSMP